MGNRGVREIIHFEGGINYNLPDLFRHVLDNIPMLAGVTVK